MPQREILTPQEAARYVRLHPQTIYRRLRTGTMPGAKIGDQWRIRKVDLDNYLKGPKKETTFEEEPLSPADLKEVRRGLAEIRSGHAIPREQYRRKRSA